MRVANPGRKNNPQETQLAILVVALAITVYNALFLEPTAQVVLEEELVRVRSHFAVLVLALLQ